MQTPLNMPSSCQHEKRVIRQLLEALLFEGIITYRYEAGVFHFTAGESSYQARGEITGYSRIRLDANSPVEVIDGKPQTISLTKLVSQLPADDLIKRQLAVELKQTIKLCRVNDTDPLRISNRRKLDYQALESAIDEGHPYHPCFKARTGFSENDHRLYGPEFGQRFQLRWLAIERRFIQMRLCTESPLNDALFWQAELGRYCYQQLQQRLKSSVANPDDYALMPIHPWQRQQLNTALEAPLAAKEIIDLGDAGDEYQASISVRTLMNVTDPGKSNVKLPMNMVNSSSLRTLAQHSICTAPVLSDWLHQLVSNDDYYATEMPLGLLDEYAGIALDSTQYSKDHWTNTLAGQLGVIFRQSVEGKFPDQTALPFVALAVTESDQKPFIYPWIERYGCEKWLDRLIDVTILPLWHLLVHHGIALEAHAQNLVLLHDEGWPTQVVVRDFHESLEYVQDYTADKSLIPDFKSLDPCYIDAPADQYFWMERVEALRELIVDTLFVYNFSEIARLLEIHHAYPQSRFWQRASHALDTYAKSGFTRMERIEAIDLTSPKIHTESLMRKKLSGKSDEEFHHSIDNPFAETDALSATA